MQKATFVGWIASVVLVAGAIAACGDDDGGAPRTIDLRRCLDACELTQDDETCTSPPDCEQQCAEARVTGTPECQEVFDQLIECWETRDRRCSLEEEGCGWLAFEVALRCAAPDAGM